MSLHRPYRLLTTNLFSNATPSLMFSNNKILKNKTKNKKLLPSLSLVFQISIKPLQTLINAIKYSKYCLVDIPAIKLED